MRLKFGMISGWSLAAIAAASLFVCSSARAIDTPGSTQAISGQPFDGTGTAAFLIGAGNHLVYTDFSGLVVTSADAGIATEVYRFPVTWADSGEATLFAADPANSPTGTPIGIQFSLEAVAYNMVGPNYTGYVVGVIALYKVTTPTTTENFEIFTPTDLAADQQIAKERIIVLATGDSKPPNYPQGTGTAQVDCVSGCWKTFFDENRKAKNTLISLNQGAACMVALPAGGLTGCGVGVALCSWIPIPGSSALCCSVGAVIGGAFAYSACALINYEAYLDKISANLIDLHSCLSDCGIVVD